MTGAELIAEERKRQIEKEGWTAEHDDLTQEEGDLAKAAAAYALGFNKFERLAQELWPWDFKFYKPTPDDPVRQLVKAGALIAAEIDRIQRGKK